MKATKILFKLFIPMVFLLGIIVPSTWGNAPLPVKNLAKMDQVGELGFSSMAMGDTYLEGLLKQINIRKLSELLQSQQSFPEIMEPSLDRYLTKTDREGFFNSGKMAQTGKYFTQLGIEPLKKLPVHQMASLNQIDIAAAPINYPDPVQLYQADDTQTGDMFIYLGDIEQILESRLPLGEADEFLNFESVMEGPGLEEFLSDTINSGRIIPANEEGAGILLDIERLNNLSFDIFSAPPQN